MPQRKLTDTFLRKVRPPSSGRDEYFDAQEPGLALRVTETGVKSFSFVYYRKSDGKHKRDTFVFAV